MKTAIFDMAFTLPPMVEMHEVEKDMPTHSHNECLPLSLSPDAMINVMETSNKRVAGSIAARPTRYENI